MSILTWKWEIILTTINFLSDRSSSVLVYSFFIYRTSRHKASFIVLLSFTLTQRSSDNPMISNVLSLCVLYLCSSSTVSLWVRSMQEWCCLPASSQWIWMHVQTGMEGNALWRRWGNGLSTLHVSWREVPACFETPLRHAITSRHYVTPLRHAITSRLYVTPWRHAITPRVVADVNYKSWTTQSRLRGVARPRPLGGVLMLNLSRLSVSERGGAWAP